MDDAGHAGRLLAGRYRLPGLPDEEYEGAETPAYDTVHGREVLLRQVPLPEIVDAEFADAPQPAGRSGTPRGAGGLPVGVRRALDAALAASRLPDHPRLGQVYDAFVAGDGLWIVGELLPARSLSELLAEERLSAHRAAEIAADVLAALRAVHAQGWVHRNITARTVQVCDDGRAVLTGLAAGAAEEALCGYDPLPDPAAAQPEPRGGIPAAPDAAHPQGRGGAPGPHDAAGPPGPHEVPRGPGPSGVHGPPGPYPAGSQAAGEAGGG
ncbi:protein kinase, partial [Streptomyces sp. JJ36]|uniref:protein kinase n=1 Tax=Streptomyces sp. JJ36 TaxID=2736645 RepID=UPI001F000395